MNVSSRYQNDVMGVQAYTSSDWTGMSTPISLAAVKSVLNMLSRTIPYCYDQARRKQLNCRSRFWSPQLLRVVCSNAETWGLWFFNRQPTFVNIIRRFPILDHVIICDDVAGSRRTPNLSSQLFLCMFASRLISSSLWSRDGLHWI